MGQMVFVGNSGGAGAGTHAVFLESLYVDDTNFVSYGFAASGGDAFYSDGSFSVVLMFRAVQENTNDNPLTLVECRDTLGAGYEILVDAGSLVAADVSGTPLTPASGDLPLGRVFIAVLTHDEADNSNVLYVNGRALITVTQAVAVKTGAVTFLLGGSAGWDNDFAEYIGFAFANRPYTALEVADLSLACQDAGRIVITGDLIAETNYAIFNAVSGLAALTLWTPEFNVGLAAPDLPQIVTGVAASALKTAPIHMAHSGWITAVVP